MDAPRLCPIVKEKDVEESLPTFAALDFSITTSTGSGKPAEGRSRQSSVTEFIVYASEQLLRGVRRHKEDVDTSEGEIAQDSLETPAEAEQDESESAAATKGVSRFSVVNGIFRRRSSAAKTAEEAPAGEAKAAEGTEETATAGAVEVPTPEAPKRASLFARFRRGSRQPSATSDAADPQAPSGDAIEVVPKGEPDAKVEEPPAASTPEVAPSPGQPAVAAVSPLQPGAAAEEAPPVADVADLRRQDAQVVFELVELGLYLKKALRLDGDVIDLFVNMNDQKNGSAGAELHKRSVLMLLEDIRRRRVEGKTDEFFDSRRAGRPAVLDMGTINECACFARDALAMLASQVRVPSTEHICAAI
jgi:hypothetical protein